MKVKFQTPSLREREKPEKNSGQILVETAGYEPTQKKIERMIKAGERLALARNFDLDGDDDPDLGIVDPTRAGHYDLADASNDLAAIREKFKTSKAAESSKATDEEKLESPGQDPTPK